MATVVVVGAGHNGLVAATLLSREGHEVTVLEQRHEAGGALALEPVHPGYRCPLQSGVGGALLPAVARALGLDGSAAAGPPSPLVGLRSDGSAIVIETDRDVHGIGRDVEARDRRRFAELTTTLARLARVVVPLLTSPPPAIDAPSLGDLVTLASAGRQFRALGRRDGYRLAQWAPMPVADLASDWLDDGLLRALVAARGVFGRFAGPRSAGTAFELILQAARTGSVMAGPPVPARPADAPRLALAQVAARAGVNVRTGTEVQQVPDRGRPRRRRPSRR